MNKLILFVFGFLLLLPFTGCMNLLQLHFRYTLHIVPGRFVMETEAGPAAIPVRSSHEPDRRHPCVNRLLVMVHGGGLNAEKSFETGMKMRRHLGEDPGQTMVVAPQFPEKGGETLEKGLLIWDGGWREGGNSLEGEASAGPALSSFYVMDTLIRRIIEQNPQITGVVLAGHSAGGQFTGRYAAVNQVHDSLAAKGVSLCYTVANPSSYLYLDENRYGADADLTACPGYNHYKYGLENRYGYAASLGAGRIRKQLLSRQVLFLVGEADRKRDSMLDTCCAADAQGRNRYERGRLYRRHLDSFAPASHRIPHKWLFLPRVGHDSEAILTHPAVLDELKAMME